ncbi:hypothetical protein J437_LFUL015686 [Ladona fulva]|uniref:Schlafen AlbA-2 domain-containing protein n=1 Tax=Ladona fulva TaxID=123851 RepID=A0A8K0KLV3_LADFU|nr:hypothetical protein J437_LFUL015686 [Ladona fulva]
METNFLDEKKRARYYVKGSVMEVEEDRTHEFKGHRNIAVEEIPPWCVDIKDKNRKTRSAISRNICGFINSELGGTIYLGVLDNGEIEGIPLTLYQQDHVKLSLSNTLQRFRPPFPKHLYSINFVPCLDKKDIIFQHIAKSPSSSKSKSEAKNGNETNTKEGFVSGGWDWEVEQKEQIILPKMLQLKEDSLRRRPHILQTYKYCWCDDDSYGRNCHGHTSTSYVVEIIIKPPSPRDPEIRKYLIPSTELHIKPIFQAEDGSIYIRRQATLIRRSLNDVVTEAVEEVQLQYLPTLKKAEIEYRKLQSLVEAMEVKESLERMLLENKGESVNDHNDP